ncbi:BA14K family protein [Ensifer soli]|uniref:BA14K family protein n=1 Tax=Ciceribacter sp. sgz301302 TaxID=3342379 RepID=UPI0035B845E4
MKPVFWISLGIYASTALFAAGFFSATTLMAKPPRAALESIDLAQLWPSTPRPVDPDSQDFERLPARPLPAPVVSTPAHISRESIETATAPSSVSDTRQTAAIEISEIDGDTTGSVSQGITDDGDAMAVYRAEHVAWCERRYRSYRPDDNTYRSYRGEIRPCVSPFLEIAMATAADAPADFSPDGAIVNVDGDATMAGFISEETIDRCRRRYASYRASDNTYRSYSGERRPCLID